VVAMGRGRGEEGASGGVEGWVGGLYGVAFGLDWRGGCVFAGGERCGDWLVRRMLWETRVCLD